MSKDKLSHFDNEGRAKMVDVGHKAQTVRKAVARSRLEISDKLVKILAAGELEKGDAFTVAKVAGILAAKKTGELIPMCHPLPIDFVGVEIELVEGKNEVRIEAQAHTTGKTGVEMEAMTAASIASLTFYDMCKAADKGIIIREAGLYKKSGGKSGEFLNPDMEWDY